MGCDTCLGDIMFADVLKWIAIPFVLSTIYFGIRKGENNYYETDKYDGNGTGSLDASLSSVLLEICVKENLFPHSLSCGRKNYFHTIS